MYNEIIPRLFLGDQQDAIDFAEKVPDGHIICVLEQRPGNEPFKSMHIPVLTSSGHVHSDQLNKVACIIDALLKQGNPLLIHCGAGIERSPLTVAWFLHKYLRLDNISEAYNLIKSKRPQIADRSEWLVVDHAGS